MLFVPAYSTQPGLFLYRAPRDSLDKRSLCPLSVSRFAGRQKHRVRVRRLVLSLNRGQQTTERRAPQSSEDTSGHRHVTNSNIGLISHLSSAPHRDSDAPLHGTRRTTVLSCASFTHAHQRNPLQKGWLPDRFKLGVSLKQSWPLRHEAVWLATSRCIVVKISCNCLSVSGTSHRARPTE